MTYLIFPRKKIKHLMLVQRLPSHTPQHIFRNMEVFYVVIKNKSSTTTSLLYINSQSETHIYPQSHPFVYKHEKLYVNSGKNAIGAGLFS